MKGEGRACVESGHGWVASINDFQRLKYAADLNACGDPAHIIRNVY